MKKIFYQCISQIAIIFSGIQVQKSLMKECLKNTPNFGKKTTGLKKLIKLAFPKKR